MTARIALTYGITGGDSLSRLTRRLSVSEYPSIITMFQDDVIAQPHIIANVGNDIVGLEIRCWYIVRYSDDASDIESKRVSAFWSVVGILGLGLPAISEPESFWRSRLSDFLYIRTRYRTHHAISADIISNTQRDCGDFFCFSLIWKKR